ncbi:hypothetical protein PybrP1_001682 [[Pythium] brassicae (nom. inval.)]|nr:hypothetical protein PybrP1_001682 [[Pythium] brassicae (nom. inval.)]
MAPSKQAESGEDSEGSDVYSSIGGDSDADVEDQSGEDSEAEDGKEHPARSASDLALFANMTRDEKQVSLMTALLVLSVADTAERKRGKGVRQRFAYYLPQLGEVCEDPFCAVYAISTPTLTVYRNRIASGDLTLAEQQGDLVPLRIHRQTTTNGEMARYVSKLDHLLLPSYYTWHDLFLETQDNAERPAGAVLLKYKDMVSALYNNVKVLQKYQFFSARHSNPGVLKCLRTPGSPPDVFDLWKAVDGELVTAERALELFHDAKPVPPPPVNSEKLIHIRVNLHLKF